jgi:predicted dehydrogenase
MIPVAIIGCGAVVQELHAPSLLELERRNVISVSHLYDPNEEELSKTSRLFPKAAKLPSLDNLHTKSRAIALVASPPKFHGDQVIKCLDSGFDVFCEKPIASTVSEANRMIETAQKKGHQLAVGHVRRFFPVAQEIRRILKEEPLGRLQSFRFREGGKFSWGARSTSFFKKSEGGGVLLDTGIHTIDLILWWLGMPMSFSYQDDSMGGVEINCKISFRYPTFSGEVQLSWDYETANKYSFEFERGWIDWIPYHADSISIGLHGSSIGFFGTSFDSTTRRWSSTQRPFNREYWELFLPEWLNFIAAIDGKEQLISPGSDAVESLKLVERCKECRTFWEPTWLSSIEVTLARELSGIVTQ